jgi:Kef-type K+ transport system membrane component KefB
MLVAFLAYLGSAFFRLQRLSLWARAFLASGLEFFVIGLILGPRLSNMISVDDLHNLGVLIDLAAGWVGLLFGLQFNFLELRRKPLRHYLGASTQALFTMGLCIFGFQWIFPWVFPSPLGLLTIICLGCAASTSSPTVVTMVIRDLACQGPKTDAIKLFCSVDAIPAIVIFGVAICFAQLHAFRFGPLQDGLYWLGVSIALAFVLGIVFHLFTLYSYADNQLLVVVIGLVVFCGGAANYLMLSPLFVNFMIGLVVANRSPARMRMLRVLLIVEKPIYLVLLTLAGAMWNPVTEMWTLITAFVFLRLAGKLIGGMMAGPIAGLATKTALGFGPGLLPQGGMALVIALSFGQLIQGPEFDSLLSATVTSILVTSLFGPWGLKKTLHDERPLP